jgi:hypothetical protein
MTNRFVIADLQKDLLGRGDMDEVHRARDTRPGHTVAVKTLDPSVLTRDSELPSDSDMCTGQREPVVPKQRPGW